MSTMKKLIEFSLDYDIQKPIEESIEREEKESNSPKFHNTMGSRLMRNDSRSSKIDLWDEDLVQLQEPQTPFNFKSLRNDE